MSRLVFLDTETTSLRPERRAWDIGLIVRDGTADVEHQWFVHSEDLDLGNADLKSLDIGRFYDRHPAYQKGADRDAWSPDGISERYVLSEVERLTRGAHLVGNVPNFDADVLDRRMRDHGICPSWHYHLIDVEALAVGYLAKRDLDATMMTLPWDSNELNYQLGIEAMPDEERHTALGDARWARAIYDRVTGGGR